MFLLKISCDSEVEVMKNPQERLFGWLNTVIIIENMYYWNKCNLWTHLSLTNMSLWWDLIFDRPSQVFV